MRVLVGNRWVEGYLDPTPGPRDYLVAVTHWVAVTGVRDMYFERPRRVGLVWDYVREIGVRGTVRRIRSRRAESVRNRRFVACGAGRVLRAPEHSPAHRVGDLVAFVAPAAPLCCDRVAVHEVLVDGAPDALPAAETRTLMHARHGEHAEDLARIGGWSEWSGIELDESLAGDAGRACAATLAGAPWHDAARLDTSDGEIVTTVGSPKGVPAARGRGRRAPAVLVGFGNYAKTTLLPHVGRSLDIRAVHEIDPLQLGPKAPDAPIAWSTDPEPDLSGCDVVLAAGYHHTHAPLAAEALRRGKVAVVEKPLATTHEQLKRVDDAARSGGGRLFLCFQRRYSRLNDYAREDLGVAGGEPIDYHCVVFEEPLPARHWYSWPSSGSRLLSNGCHWIDHFLYLNGFAQERRLDLRSPRPDLINATVTLDNGAVFTMVLTDAGSRRVGVREHVELRAGEVTVRITDASKYEAESSTRRLRRASVNKLDAYRRMYRTIGARIADGLPGDDAEADLLSARLTLDLDALVPPAEVAAPSTRGPVLRSR